MAYSINSDTPGRAPHIKDTTMRWVNTYRTGNKTKPAFILRAATDSNYINNSMIALPAYGGAVRNAQAISNILSPGQRVQGVLNWQATESLENVTQTASVSVMDVLPLSKITATITGFKIGTGGKTDILYRGLDTNGKTLSSGPTSFDVINPLPARWHSAKIRYQWVRDGLGIAQQLGGDNRIDQYRDKSLDKNEFGKHTFREDNLLYRMFEPEVIQVDDLSKFPNPAVPPAEAEGSNEWWNVDLGVLTGVGAYYILVGKEVMRVVRTDSSNNYIFVIPGCRGVAGQIGTHNVGDTVTLLGFPPYSPQWTGLGYLTPSDYKLSQSPFRPGTCWVSYEGYGNPGDYSHPKGNGPFSTVGTLDNQSSKTFDRANNMVFTGYWFTQSPSASIDDTGNPQLQVSFNSSGYILSEQKINQNNTQRSKNLFDSWAKTTFDKIGYKRSMPGDWFDFNMWDPTLPGAYPLTISTEYAQNKAFMDHMNQTNMGTQCEWGHPKTTKVLTPVGWKEVGDLKVGDKVIGANGSTTKVTALYPRGVLPIYRTTFNDGASVLTDGGHLWKVRTTSMKYKHGEDAYVVRETRELKDTLKRKWQIPMVQPVQFASNEPFELDPYLLGLLLGDGYLGGGNSSSVVLAANNPKVVEEAKKVLPYGHLLSPSTLRGAGAASDSYRVTCGNRWREYKTISSMLRELTLEGVRLCDKFIPDRYKFASSPSARLAVLQGLIDSDGEVNSNKYVAFYSTSKQLAEDIRFLVQSLGGIAKISLKHNPCLSYRVSIKLPDLIPTRAKLDGFRPTVRYPVTRIIRSVEPEGEAEVICLEVDAPDNLYVTEHCLVTHNCQKEWIDFVMNHEHSTPTGSIHEARAVGKHIYFESIRVFNLGGQFNAGPIKTYGRLMHALAQAAWDNPQPGDNLGTRWTKLPNQLHQNLNTWTNGRVWNGQLFYDTENKSVKTYDWSNMPDNDRAVYGKRKALHCPFTSQYDNQPWSQPMQDLASLNRMTYTLTREGFPVFIPIGHKLRGMPSSSLNNIPGFHYSGSPSKYFVNNDGVEVADSDIGLGEWHLAYGGAVASYSSTVDPSAVLTIVYVSCQTAFGTEISFTLPAAGTGVKFRSHGGGAGLSTKHGEKAPAQVVMYSNVVGNKEGLELTSGAQQTDTASLDNLLLGLDWNTNPASWGLTLKRGADGLNQVDARPPVPTVKPNMNIAFDTKDSKDNPAIVRDIQKFLNFMLERRYIGGAVFIASTGVTETALQIAEDGKFTGKWGKAMTSAIQLTQTFMSQQSNQNNLGGAKFKKVNGNWKYIQENGNARNDTDNDGQWGVATYLVCTKWLDTNSEYIKTDIWWYVQNGLPWDQYVAAVTGFAIPQNQVAQTDGLWQLDQLGIAVQGENWMKKFFIDAITYGNSIVDDTINKAYQKTISSNYGDPRIQIGDVLWISVPGYSSHTDMFGHTKVPFRNGMYVTSISRSIDLQNATFQATYQGYRYRGQLDHNVIKNFNNYVSKVNKV